MIEQTQDQLEFHSKLEVWYGYEGKKPMALNLIEGMRIQGEYICLKLITDDGGDCEEWAIKLSELVKDHGIFIKYSDKECEEESKKEILQALRDAISAIENQFSDQKSW